MYPSPIHGGVKALQCGRIQFGMTVVETMNNLFQGSKMTTDKDSVGVLFTPDPQKGVKVPLFSIWLDLLFGGL